MTDSEQPPASAPNAHAWRLLRTSWFGPAVLAGLFVVILGGLLWLMQARVLDSNRRDLHNSINSARESIRQHLQADESYFREITDGIAQRTINKELFHKQLSEYMADHPELTSLVYIDAEGIGKWAVPDGHAVTPDGQPLACPLSRQGFAEARKTRQVHYSKPHMSLLGEPAFDVNIPIFREDEFLGTFVVVYSCRRLVRHMLHREILQGHRVSLVDDRDNVIVSLPAVERIDERLIDTVDIVPPGQGLRLRLGRYGAGFWGLGIALLTLLCVALVVGMAWGMWSLNRHIARRAVAEESLRQARNELAERVLERTADLERANVQLQKEMRDRRLAEERARQRQDELAHVARVSTMGEMAAGLAHEINQPLGAISSFAEGSLRLIESGTPDLGLLGEALGEVADQARRAGRIIRRLRTFVAKGKPQKSICNMRALTEEVVDLIAMDIRHEKILFRLDISESVPPVSADLVQIQQVVLNLMRNAIEAMTSVEADDRELVVGASVLENMVVVAVSDSGPPCSATDLSKIFDAFYTTKESGIGMGLSISRSIVQAHGGRIWATPNAEAGLTVRFSLPLAHGDQEEQGDANEQQDQ